MSGSWPLYGWRKMPKLKSFIDNYPPDPPQNSMAPLPMVDLTLTFWPAFLAFSCIFLWRHNIDSICYICLHQTLVLLFFENYNFLYSEKLKHKFKLAQDLVRTRSQLNWFSFQRRIRASVLVIFLLIWYIQWWQDICNRNIF